QAIHPRIYLQMKSYRLALRVSRRGAIQKSELFAAMHDRRQIVPEQMWFFSCHETRQDQHRFFHSGSAHGNPPLLAPYAKPVRSEFLQSLSDLRSAMSVAVSFHDAQHFAWRLALFAGRIHVRANRIEVVFQRAE